MAVNEDQFERGKLYQASMNMFQAMLKDGIITEEQYAIVIQKWEKYQPIIGTLYRKRLINKAFRVMYSTGKE